MKPDYREIFNECHWMTYYAWKHQAEERKQKEYEQKNSKEDTQH